MVLVRRLEDDAAAVRIVAAEALARYGDEGDAAKALDVLVSHIDPRKNSLTVVIAAMNSLDAAGDRAKQVLPRLASLPKDDPGAGTRYPNLYTALLRSMLAKLR